MELSQEREVSMMTRIIAIVNQKGGVGKTTTAINLGAALAQSGKSVLLLDMDPQASLSSSLGIRDPAVTMYDFLTSDEPVRSAIVHAGSIDLIPSSPDLAGAELELASQPGREFILREKIAAFSYDFIFIDCPPGLGLLTLNALTAAQELLIPLQAEYLALDGLARLTETVDLVQRRLNHNLVITGILVTRYDQRRRLNREVIEAIRNHFPNELIDQPVRENISLAEAPSFCQDIFSYKPDSSGAMDYLSLAKEIIRRKGQ